MSLAALIALRIAQPIRLGIQQRVQCLTLPRTTRAAFEPKREGCSDRVDTSIPSPRGFITAAVDLAMVSTA